MVNVQQQGQAAHCKLSSSLKASRALARHGRAGISSKQRRLVQESESYATCQVRPFRKLQWQEAMILQAGSMLKAGWPLRAPSRASCALQAANPRCCILQIAQSTHKERIPANRPPVQSSLRWDGLHVESACRKRTRAIAPYLMQPNHPKHCSLLALPSRAQSSCLQLGEGPQFYSDVSYTAMPCFQHILLPGRLRTSFPRARTLHEEFRLNKSCRGHVLGSKGAQCLSKRI